MPDVPGSPPTVDQVIAALGTPFAVFDGRTQDSGHVSYGVTTPDGRRLFAKTSGTSAPAPGGTTQPERAAILRRAAQIHHEIRHPALVPLREVVEASDGVVVVHDWFEGELLACPPEPGDPDGAHQRFRALPAGEIAAALDRVIGLHVDLERAGGSPATSTTAA